MTITHIRASDPLLRSWSWDFASEEEAHLFHLNEKDELDGSAFFEYVDYDVSQTAHDTWRLRVDYLDNRRPEATA